MGYYTDFTLEMKFDFISKEEKEKTYKQITNFMQEDPVWAHVFNIEPDFTDYFYCANQAKWYDYRDYMEKLSNEFPNVVFILHGTGEDPEDEWKEEYHNNILKTKHKEFYWTDWEQIRPAQNPDC